MLLRMVNSQAGRDTDPWEWAYSHLLTLEQHWTDQVQNQQQRISTILAVNGLVLGFLASGDLSKSILTATSWAAFLFIVSLVLLSMALAMGVLSLRPRIPVAKETWLDSYEVRALAGKLTKSEMLRELCESMERSQTKANLPNVMEGRRRLMFVQLVLLVAGLVVLVMALIAFRITSN